MKRLAIIGAGDLGEMIAYHAVNDKQYTIIGFYDDFINKGAVIHGYNVLGKTDNLQEDFDSGLFDYIMVGIGYKFMTFRKMIFEKYYGKIPFGNIIHSSAYVDNSVRMGEGVFILPGCTIDKHVRIGNNVLINTAAVIAHDSEIRNHCFISPAANIAGKTIIMDCCIIGINATIIDNLTIGSNIQVAGGSVVIKNLSETGLYAGVPAIFKKKLI